VIHSNPTAGTRRLTGRHVGRYRGEVVDVDDPRSMGRLRLRVPELFGDVESGWALPAFAATGDGSGVFAIPPVGALVWVEFEAGDTSRPVWVGGWFAEGSLPEGANPQKLVIRTPGGQVITLDDDGGKLEILESGGASIVLDSNGIELAKGGQKIVIGSSSVTINDGALEVN
jgi:phage baseplate assembly protein gpV